MGLYTLDITCVYFFIHDIKHFRCNTLHRAIMHGRYLYCGQVVRNDLYRQLFPVGCVTVIPRAAKGWCKCIEGRMIDGVGATFPHIFPYLYTNWHTLILLI